MLRAAHFFQLAHLVLELRQLQPMGSRTATRAGGAAARASWAAGLLLDEYLLLRVLELQLLRMQLPRTRGSHAV